MSKGILEKITAELDCQKIANTNPPSLVRKKLKVWLPPGGMILFISPS
jgi:hypothetical protein